MRRIITSIFILMALTYAGHVIAQVSFMPPIVDEQVVRGRTTSLEYKITNRGPETVSLHFVVHDVIFNEEGAANISDDSTYNRGASSWVTLRERVIELSPFSNYIYTIDVSTPTSAEGSYYAMLQANIGSMKINEGTEQKANIEIESSVAVLLMFTVNTRTAQDDLSADTLFVYPSGTNDRNNAINAGYWSILLPLRNDGLIHTIVNGKVVIYSSSGVLIEREPLTAGKGYVFPGLIRNFRANGSSTLQNGYYVLNLFLETSSGKTIQETVPFSVINGTANLGEGKEESSELLRASMPKFRVLQPIVNRQINPGRISAIPIHLQNVSGDSLILKVDKVEWSIDDYGNIIYSKFAPDHYRSNLKWIEIEHDTLIIPPNRSISSKALVKAPEEIIVGEYYGALSYLPIDIDNELLNQFRGARSQLIILSGVDKGTSVANVGDIVFQESKSEAGGPSCSFDVVIKNSGSSYFTINGKLSFERQVGPGIFEPYGESVKFGQNDVVLPGKERHFTINAEMSPGIFRAHVQAGDYEERASNFLEFKVNGS